MKSNSIESSIIRILTAELKSICPNVFFGKSQVIYPKINADLRTIGDETPQQIRYRLTLDYYSNDSTPITAVTMSEDVRSALSDGMIYDESGALITTRKTSGGGFVEEKDSEKVVHYMDAYELDYYKNRDF